MIRFGVFEADLAAGELRRNGVKVRLQDLPFRMLTILLSRPGEVVTREEFRQALWPPDVFVDFEQGISSAVMRLRDALRDSADNPVFIETIERRGYRWIGPIHPPEQVAEVTPTRDPSQEISVPVNIARPSASRHWRKLLFAIPVLVIVVAFWQIHPGNRNAEAGPKSIAAAAHSPHSPANHEAEEFYLKGRFYWNKRTPESLNQAVDAFSEALARDPKYSDAYVGLADCYNLMREFSLMPSNEAYFKAFAAAKKAVELDDQSAAAHASLAFVSFWGMWDARSAETEFRRAIELDPKNAKAHHWFATFLQAVNRNQEAMTEIEAARKLDPNSSAILADKGEILEVAGHHQEALQLLTQLESAEPDFLSPHRYLRISHFFTGDYAGFIAELKKEGQLLHDPAAMAQADAASKGLAGGGEHGLLEALLAEQVKLNEKGKLNSWEVAQTEAKLGDAHGAVKYLSECVRAHDEHMVYLDRDRLFDNLHGNLEFEKLIAIIGVAANKT